eukprot:TRINITY_DN3532_c0_g1_i1.p1 TRINITY_DN3532_c0_g1~~TRINITY_DN3532_c0_g1_i1.p1  ORF type:complete len:443 (+),score=38.67 TRINITY_DN3532_c0_g1_i1:41-1369(+)
MTDTTPVPFSFTWAYLRSPDVANEAKEIAKLSVSFAISNFCFQLLGMINIAFIGHLGSTQLAGIALGSMYSNIFGYSFTLGILSAVDTLATQAYGANNLPRVGVIFQRSLLIALILSVFIAAIWYFSDAILLLAGQDEQVVEYSTLYLRRLIVGLPFYILWEALKKYLQVQSIAAPIAYVSILGVFSVTIANVIFWKLEWGILGAANALVITFVLMAITLVGYVKYYQIHKDTWHPWNTECLKGWIEYFKLAVPGTIMYCAEWWGYEVHTLVAGLISETALAVTSVLLNTVNLIFMIPLGISSAATTRVGNALGNSDAIGAKRAAWVAIGIDLVIEIAIFVIILGARSYWGLLFTNDEQVLDLLSKLSIGLSVFAVLDSISGVSGGILRGSGRHVLGAIVGVAMYWLGQLPTATILALWVGWGVYGQWLVLLLLHFFWVFYT